MLGQASEKEVKAFIKLLRKSQEMESREHLVCSLRMINSVFIIRTLTDGKARPLTERVDDAMELGEARQLFNAWSAKLMN